MTRLINDICCTRPICERLMVIIPLRTARSVPSQAPIHMYDFSRVAIKSTGGRMSICTTAKAMKTIMAKN